MTAEYEPDPVRTAGVTLGEDLIGLSEVLAKNAHERWAQQRLAEGWRYGPKRDDDLREHPCLVPYESLPESEPCCSSTTHCRFPGSQAYSGYSDREAGRRGH